MSRVEIVENYLASQTQFPEDAHKLENPLSGHVDISIIVPIFNEDAVLPNLLHALENQIYRGFELVVVDNGSTDNSLLRLSQFSQKSPFEIVIIKEEKPGIGNARKLGLDFAVRRVRNRDKTLFRKHALLLTDADVAPPPNWTKVVKEKLDSLPPSCLSGTHGADPKIEKVISRGLGLTYYFNKIPSAIEWLQKAKFGIIKMSGPNASFEIEAYCAGGGMQQKEDVLDNAVVVKGVSQLGWRAEERGYPILPMWVRVVSSRRRQLLEILSGKKMYITNYNPQGRVYPVREPERVLLKEAINLVPRKRWIEYQVETYKAVLCNLIFKPITDGKLKLSSLEGLFGKELYKSFLADLRKEMERGNRLQESFINKWAHIIISIIERATNHQSQQ